jgi:DNA-binding MarR family transcriptional regulator
LAFTERGHPLRVTGHERRNLGRVTAPKDIDPIVSLSRASLTEVLYRVEQQRRALVADALLPRDLNLTQWIALNALAKAGASTMTELALACAMDRTSLTRTIDSLVARGLVDRSTPPSDRRTVLVEVSPSGRSLADDVMAQLGGDYPTMSQASGSPRFRARAAGGPARPRSRRAAGPRRAGPSGHWPWSGPRRPRRRR